MGVYGPNFILMVYFYGGTFIFMVELLTHFYKLLDTIFTAYLV